MRKFPLKNYVRFHARLSKINAYISHVKYLRGHWLNRDFPDDYLLECLFDSRLYLSGEMVLPKKSCAFSCAPVLHFSEVCRRNESLRGSLIRAPAMAHEKRMTRSFARTENAAAPFLGCRGTIATAAEGQVNSHSVNWSVAFCRFCKRALVGLKTHKIGSAAIQHWPSGAPSSRQSCCHWLKPLVSVQEVHITYLIQALRRGPVKRL